MSPFRERVQELFLAALELPLAERDEFLRIQSDGDERLFEEVATLVAAHPTSGSIGTGGIAAQVITYRPGEFIGPYEVLEFLGAGSYGEVYRVQQKSPEREVALKLLSALHDEAAKRRFLYEGDALGRMHHPNVAAVYETATTPVGIPFIVMELIRGDPVTEYCDTNQFSIEDRLRLFSDVCHAVEHIHRNLFIHRDLKPNNILVEIEAGSAVPKVVDFGIAKPLGKNLHRGAVTEVGLFLGTTAYSSPEQLRGITIDRRSDVYSLGVLLCELLVGRRPFEMKDDEDIPAFTVRVQRELAPRPSHFLKNEGAEVSTICAARRTTPRALARTMRNHLDWVVLRAMAKEPESRYDSAADLGKDIANFLNGRPVNASQSGRIYRLKTHIRRNARTIAAGLGVVVLTAALWVAFASSRTAERNLQALEDIAGLVSVIGELADIPGALESKRQLAEIATTTLAEVQRQRGGVELEAQLATAYEQLGRLQADPYAASVGDTDGGIKSLREALRLREKLLALTPDDPARARDVAQSCFTLAIVLQPATIPVEDRLVPLNRGIAVGEQILARFPDDVEATRVLAMAYDLLAEWAWAGGAWDQTIELISRAHDLKTRILDTHPDKTEIRRLLAGSYGRMAYAAQNASEARDLALRALQFHEDYLDLHPYSFRAILDLSFAYRNAAYAVGRNGATEQAVELQTKGFKLRERILRADEDDIRSYYLVSDAAHALGASLLVAGRLQDALRYNEMGLRIREEIVDRPYPPSWIHSSMFFSWRNLARTHAQLEDCERAGEYYTKLVNQEMPLGIGLKSLWQDHIEYGHLLNTCGREEVASEMYRAALEITKDLDRFLNRDGSAIPRDDMALAYTVIARLLPAEREELLKRAWEIPVSEKEFRPVREVVANELGCALADSGRLVEAESVFREGLEGADPSVASVLEANLQTVLDESKNCGVNNDTEKAECDVPRFVSSMSSEDTDPYANLGLVLIRKWESWGNLPLPVLSRRIRR